MKQRHTELEETLRSLNLKYLVLVGLTSDHCVSTTARMGADLGFKIEIPYDGVATFDRVNHKGIQFYADEIQAVSLASLHQEFAKVTSIKSIAKSIGS